jgi:hypothetical protein
MISDTGQRHPKLSRARSALALPLRSVTSAFHRAQPRPLAIVSSSPAVP